MWTCMRGRRSGRTRLSCGIRTKPPRIYQGAPGYDKTKPNDAALANEIMAEAEACFSSTESAEAYHPDGGRGRACSAAMSRRHRIPNKPRGSVRAIYLVGLWHMEMGRVFLGLRQNRRGGRGRPEGHRLGYRHRSAQTALAAFDGAADKIPEARAALAEADETVSQSLRGLVTHALWKVLLTRRRVSAMA